MGQLTRTPGEKPPLFIVTGPREVGKTSFIKYLLNLAKTNAIDTAGVLSPAVFVEDQKTGIDLQDPRSGVCQRLANLRHSENEGIFTERWMFSKEVMDWGNELLARATPCDLLIVDELGPIELERGEGWQNGIAALNSGDYQAEVVVIRPELLDAASQLWPNASIISIQNNQDPQNSLFAGQILKMIK